MATPGEQRREVHPTLLLKVTVTRGAVEAVADLLWVHGATAVEEAAGTEPEEIILLASLPTAAAVTSVRDALPSNLRPQIVVVNDTDWQDAWKKFAEPVRIGPMTVAPSWKPVPVGGGGLVIELDPGRCFGSGTHPSTRLLLDQLVRRITGGERVLDVGTGSGILAVAAARLGAGSVVAIDIEPEALDVTASNAARNGVDALVTTGLEIPTTRFDVVLVNVTAAVQAELAPRAVAAVAPGGVLLLAGLLPGQWPHIAPCYGALQLEQELALDDWVGAALQRPPMARAATPADLR